MFLDKLDYLMKKKGINKNVLAKESGIPYTTIDGFYKKGYENMKLSTMRRLSEYFNVSLDYLVGVDDFTATKNELLPPIEEGIVLYNSLDEIDKAEIRGEMKQMLKDPKYQQDNAELA